MSKPVLAVTRIKKGLRCWFVCLQKEKALTYAKLHTSILDQEQIWDSSISPLNKKLKTDDSGHKRHLILVQHLS